MVLEGEAQLVSASLLDWPMMVPPSHLTALQTGTSRMDTACFPRREALSSSSVYPTVCWDLPSPEGAKILQTEPRAR